MIQLGPHVGNPDQLAVDQNTFALPHHVCEALKIEPSFLDPKRYFRSSFWRSFAHCRTDLLIDEIVHETVSIQSNQRIKELVLILVEVSLGALSDEAARE